MTTPPTSDRTRDDEADEAFQFRDWDNDAFVPIIAHVTLDMLKNTVIDDLIQRAGRMHDVAIEHNDFNVAARWNANIDWLREQKVCQ